MFHIEQTKDYERIGNLINHLEIKDGLLSGEYNIEKLKRDDVTYYLLCYDATDVGICVILHSNSYHFVDVGFINKVRGKIAKKLALMVWEDFFRNYPNSKLHAMISRKNKASFYFCKWIGFKLLSMDEKSYYVEGAKDGRCRR